MTIRSISTLSICYFGQGFSHESTIFLVIARRSSSKAWQHLLRIEERGTFTLSRASQCNRGPCKDAYRQKAMVPSSRSIRQLTMSPAAQDCTKRRKRFRGLSRCSTSFPLDIPKPEQDQIPIPDSWTGKKRAGQNMGFLVHGKFCIFAIWFHYEKE